MNEPLGDSDWLASEELALVDMVACDTADCLNEATHFTKVNCCGAVLLACGPCMKKVGKLLITLIHHDETVSCASCDVECNPKGWMTKPEKLRLDSPE